MIVFYVKFIDHIERLYTTLEACLKDIDSRVESYRQALIDSGYVNTDELTKQYQDYLSVGALRVHV